MRSNFAQNSPWQARSRLRTATPGEAGHPGVTPARCQEGMSTPGSSAAALLDELDARYGRAKVADEYAQVRADAVRVAQSASGLDAFRARIIAADCLYLQADTGTAVARQSMLAQLPGEIASAAEHSAGAVAQAPAYLVERFARLADAAARSLLRSGTSDGEADDGWKRMARVIEQELPVEVILREERWGSDWRDCSAKVAVGLGIVSLLHGNADHGCARFRYALVMAFEAGDALAYRRLCDDAYGWIKLCSQRRWMLVIAAGSLQTIILGHVDLLRRKFVSRAGRAWIAQIFDTLVSTFQRDMAEPALPSFDASADPEALESLFDVLRDRLFRAIEFANARLLLDQITWGTRPFLDAAAARRAIEQERALIALPSALPSDDSRIGREIQLVSRLPMVFWQDPKQSPAAYRVQADRIGALETMFSEQDAGLNDVEPVAELDAIRQELRDDEAIIEYAIPRDTLHPAPCIYILAITRRRARHVTVPLDSLKQFPEFYKGDIGSMSVGDREPIDESPLGELVFQTRVAIQRGDTTRANAFLKILNMVLVAPLAQIGIKPMDFACWYIVPTGLLHMVPFRALVDADGGYLNDRVATCVLPSASVWLSLHQPWTEPTRFVAFANPRLDPARWSPLSNTQAEIEAAASLLNEMPAEIFVQADANLNNFARWAPQGSIVHVASHGEFPQSDVIDFHHIALTPGLADDGALSAEFVRGVPLHATQLVVLSVCNGGLLRVSTGNELLGLVPAVLEAGGGSVLTTLWEVDDAMTRLWMREFYRNIGKLGPAKAAKAACRALIAAGASIRDWAGFTLIGAATKPADG
jgi:CHAT domain-containing protein